MTEWEKYKNRKTAGLGFISRLNAWREPTPAEKAAALALEINKWQKTKGYKPRVSEEYKISKGNGRNLKTDRVDGDLHPRRKEAIQNYIETPITIGQDLWVDMDMWTAIKHWFNGNKVKVGSFFKWRIK